MNETRTSFLQRIRDAVAFTPPSQRIPHPVLNPAALRNVPPDADLTKLFIERAKETGLQVTSMTLVEIAPWAIGILKRISAVRIAIEQNSVLQDLAKMLRNEFQVFEPPFDDETLFSADVGITAPPAAIAETGSLVCFTGPSGGRSLSLIPPVHLAIVQSSRIVPDLMDWPKIQSEPANSSCMTLISGPSKTADIEGILITGMHGPAEVHVAVVSET